MADNLQVFIVRDFTEIRTFASFARAKTELVLRDSGRRYVFEVDSTEQDTGTGAALRPLDVAIGSPGRWIARGTLSGRVQEIRDANKLSQFAWTDEGGAVITEEGIQVQTPNI